MTWLAIRSFLAGVPREVWYGLAAALFLLWLSGNRYDAGRESVLTELREAQAEAEKRAAKAAENADAVAHGKAREFEVQQEALQEAIDEAESSDTNALDAVFSGL